MRPTVRPKASGGRSSTRPSAAGSCCWPSCSPSRTPTPCPPAVARSSISSTRRWTPSGSAIILLDLGGRTVLLHHRVPDERSRMLFAFSRDRAVPGHQLWSKVSKNKIPANGVIITAVLAATITLPALVEVDINGAPVPVALLRGGVDRRRRPLSVLRGADLPALADGRRVQGGPVEPARSPQVDGSCRGHRNHHHLDHRDVPDVLGRRAVGSTPSNGSTSTTPRSWSVAC